MKTAAISTRRPNMIKYAKRSARVEFVSYFDRKGSAFLVVTGLIRPHAPWVIPIRQAGDHRPRGRCPRSERGDCRRFNPITARSRAAAARRESRG
jgi:hypothetical protein